MADGEQYGGIIAPDLKSATMTHNGVTIKVAAPCDSSPRWTPDQVRALVGEIQRRVLEQK